MKDDIGFESLLRDALTRKGRPAPFPVEVADRVMARVAELGPPVRAEIGIRQIGPWAAAAAVVGTALVAAALWQGWSLSAAALYAGHWVAAVTDTALKLSAPAQTLAEAFGRVCAALLTSARTLARPLVSFQPLAQVMIEAIAAAMLGITTFVVGRDVLPRFAHKEHP